jgi:hypothetical protein
VCGDAAALSLGDPVPYGGRDCVVRGVDPMSVAARRVELEDVESGERFRVLLSELCAGCDSGS